MAAATHEDTGHVDGQGAVTFGFLEMGRADRDDGVVADLMPSSPWAAMLYWS